MGVNILLKGTISIILGDYILKDILAGEHTLLFSFIGFKTTEVVLGFKAGEEK